MENDRPDSDRPHATPGASGPVQPSDSRGDSIFARPGFRMGMAFVLGALLVGIIWLLTAGDRVDQVQAPAADDTTPSVLPTETEVAESDDAAEAPTALSDDEDADEQPPDEQPAPADGGTDSEAEPPLPPPPAPKTWVVVWEYSGSASYIADAAEFTTGEIRVTAAGSYVPSTGSWRVDLHSGRDNPENDVIPVDWITYENPSWTRTLVITPGSWFLRVYPEGDIMTSGYTIKVEELR